MNAFFYEFWGTFIITYAYNFSDGASFTRAFSYFIGWIIAVDITGAHFNPAITYAVYIYERRFKDNLKCLLVFFVA
jgi:glycerol uptake facilitator-like aquaporin